MIDCKGRNSGGYVFGYKNGARDQQMIQLFKDDLTLSSGTNFTMVLDKVRLDDSLIIFHFIFSMLKYLTFLITYPARF